MQLCRLVAFALTTGPRTPDEYCPAIAESDRYVAVLLFVVMFTASRAARFGVEKKAHESVWAQEACIYSQQPPYLCISELQKRSKTANAVDNAAAGMHQLLCAGGCQQPKPHHASM
jgi:hypothetical protein